jgi:hypothetical protein
VVSPSVQPDPVLNACSRSGVDQGRVRGATPAHHLLNSHVYSSDGLTVLGLHEEPAIYGTLAGRCLARQLQRAVARQDWIRKGELVGSRWVLADTGMPVAQTVDTNWSVRGARDRITLVR